MKLRKFMCVATAAVLTTSVLFTGCSSKNGDNNGTGGNNGQTNDKVNEDIFEDDGVFSKFDQNYTWNSDATVITLGNEDVEITKGGEYIISGTLSDGRIYINVTDDEKVQLILNGVNISCSESAAIYVENADKVAVTLPEGTKNVLSDGGSDADGCIFSKDDISFNGKGSLEVNGNVNNGIDCNNDIKFASGNITVNAINNGIKAKETISVKDANITVTADDTIKVSDKNDATVGSFYMVGGTLNLNAEDDGIVAVISVEIKGGKVNVDAADKSINCDGEEKIADGCVVSK